MKTVNLLTTLNRKIVHVKLSIYNRMTLVNGFRFTLSIVKLAIVRNSKEGR